jgi:hypothetical protein
LLALQIDSKAQQHAQLSVSGQNTVLAIPANSVRVDITWRLPSVTLRLMVANAAS